MTLGSDPVQPEHSEKPTGLLIFGAGETARMAAEYFQRDSPLQVKAFVVDEAYKKSDTVWDRPLLSFTEALQLHPPNACQAFVAVGFSRLNHDRAELMRRLKSEGYALASYVSSRAFVWHDVSVGENCFILENNVLQSRVTVGHGVTLWSGNHIGHFATIGAHCFLTSHVVVSGFCSIGEYSFLGVNSCVADYVRVAACNYIAMGTALNRNTEEDAVYSGNPADKSLVSARRFCKV